MTIILSEPSRGPVVCKPWCTDDTGHIEERYREDQSCLSKIHRIPLSLHKPIELIGGGTMPYQLEAALTQGPDEAPVIEILSPGDVRLTVDEARLFVEHLQSLLGLVEAAAK